MRRNSGRELRNGQCGFQGHLDGRFTQCDHHDDWGKTLEGFSAMHCIIIEN